MWNCHQCKTSFFYIFITAYKQGDEERAEKEELDYYVDSLEVEKQSGTEQLSIPSLLDAGRC